MISTDLKKNFSELGPSSFFVVANRLKYNVPNVLFLSAATFVWSHLKNLGSSSLPSRVEIQGLLSGNTMPQLEDSPDFRMFSKNVEQSVFFDQYNAGKYL